MQFSSQYHLKIVRLEKQKRNNYSAELHVQTTNETLTISKHKHI